MSEKCPDAAVPVQNLPEYGENAARRERTRGGVSGRRVCADILAALGELERTCAGLDAASASAASEGAEWLLDNRYLAEREGRGAAAEFRRAGRLRAVKGGALVVAACSSFLRARCGRFGEAELEAFLSGYQRVHPLDRREISLLIPAMRAALVFRLAACRGDDSSAPEAVFTSLRLLSTLDLSGLLLRCDITDGILRKDPAGVYPLMDERTRDAYRRRVTALAKKARMDEQTFASSVLRRAESADGGKRHVGRWLENGAGDARGRVYIAASVVLTLFFSLLAGFLARSVWAVLLTLIPVFEAVRAILDRLAARLTAPNPPARMELRGGVPPEGGTVCVVSALLCSPEAGERLARRLEEFSLASRECGPELVFGLLADLPESAERSLPSDAAAIAAAKRAVDGLNEKYGGGFYLFCRRRTLSERDGRWRGRERKRGAILALARLITGVESELAVVSGQAERLRGKRYIITLDEDTRLGPGTARELIGAVLHPLNRPVIDRERGVVVSGHGLIHPRVGVELASWGRSAFSRLFAGQGGTDPYCGACSELWMDLTGRGGFAGKGIIDISALLVCAGNLPEDAVLSHDAVEGALLRGGYMSDCELTDGFPSSPSSWARRLDRWTRGDWQNLPFVFDRRLADIDRWRLAFGLAGSLFAPAAALSLALWALFSGPVFSAAAIASAAGLCADLAGAFFSDAAHPDARREKYHSSVPHGLPGALARVFARLVLLPFEAWTRLRAAATALWRMYITRRRLLSWQTAAESEAAAGRFLSLLLSMWPSLALGAALFVFSPYFAGKALGAVWLLSPAAASALGRPRRSPEAPDAETEKWLLSRAGEIWGYFETFCSENDHFLPPDNWQESPPIGLAHRTSPTNIGLALVSALAASDLGLTGSAPALALIEKILGTAESLPKWRGHLFNWYDTRSLRPLTPEYVSTVDSGNLAACLLALGAGCRELGRPDLADRAERLRSAMDFSALYEPSRGLFRIGFDVAAEKLSDGFYDLMASEARLTGYLAVAKGDVPPVHWRRLSRALVRCGPYHGLASWTGTMFEYLMPELFLPPVRDSLLWESAQFCLYVQKRDMAAGLPWGESESAFFSLDPALSYRYKAHGCAALALRRGMGSDAVVSPYSSFLALAADPSGAVKNLRALERLGAVGRFGFWEAVDFTPSRCRLRGGETVRCVMAHHLGMSIVAADNYLRGGIMRRRFMSDPAAAAFSGLLAERVPIGAAALRRHFAEPPEKPSRAARGAWEITGEGTDFARPACCLLSNGVYSLTVSESGLSAASAGGIGVYAGPDSPLRGPAGLALTLRRESGSVCLLPQPGTRPGAFEFSFGGGSAQFSGSHDGFSSRCVAAVSASDTAEIRLVELRCRDAVRGELVLELEPTLCRARDRESHPAFWQLGMRAETRGGALLITRLPRGDAAAACLCIASDRQTAFSANADGAPLGWLSCPAVRAVAEVDVPAGGVFSARFALAFAADCGEAAAAARRALAAGPADCADLSSAYASLCGMTPRDAAAAMEMSGALVFPRASGSATQPRDALWRLGISGDEPIICAGYDSAEQSAAAEALIRKHALLRICGLRADLVFITGEGGDYHRALARSVSEALSRLGLDTLSGARGGVHTADSSAAEAIRAAAALEIPLSAPDTRRVRRTGDAYPPIPKKRRGGSVEYRWLDDGVFEFTVRDCLPRRVWSNVLANGGFGFLAADAGVGFMWRENAREGRINRWDGDPLSASGPESLEMSGGGARFSLFAAEDGLPCRVRFGFGWASWEKEGARVTAFVPPDVNARVLVIEGAGGDVLWHTGLVLAGEERDARFTVTREDGGVLEASNSRSNAPEAVFRCVFSAPPADFTCDEAAWLRGEPGGETGSGLAPCFAARLPCAPAVVIACGCCGVGELKALASPDGAARSLAATRRHWSSLLGRLRVRTPDAALDRYLNGWAAYQAIACRLLGRASVYQCGGALGFRDQLQDAVNLILLTPEFARERILDCCRHQYSEGDVMHWWHPGPDGGRGVRTRISDDLIWLPWAVCEYTDRTGDGGLLETEAPFLSSPELRRGEPPRYGACLRADGAGSVLEHAARAASLVIKRGTGEHGLLLMGSGDWNDGMDAVGAGGKGESVWLTWFFSHTARRLAALLDRAGRRKDAANLLSAAIRCGRAADRAWDGGWYLRGYYDDASPLGSRDSRGGCEIDSIAQSWASLCAEADPPRCREALSAAVGRLFDRDAGIVRLFSPPFEGAEASPGYIKSYGPGFRENGGQYTHGALWLASACLRAGMTRDGYDILRAVLPPASPCYGAEPFVLAADVSACPDRYGEAGWSWYTGSAGWFFRVAAGELLGLRLENGRLDAEPRLPDGWDGFDAEWTDADGEKHTVCVTRSGVAVDCVEIHKYFTGGGII